MKRIRDFFSSFIKTCPKTGRFRGFRFNTMIAKLFFPVIGLAAFIWFAIRVIPKPNRASYPCMKVAAPLASGFVVWLAGLTTSVFAFHKAKRFMQQSRYWVAAAMIVVAIFGAGFMTLGNNEPARADYAVVEDPFGPNNPIGEAKGIYPGRVVWVHNPDATNEYASWQDLSRNNKDVWYSDANNNQDVIDAMFSQGIQTLTGETSDKTAWDAIFKYFNKNYGKGEVSYEEGEEIFIKTNATSTWTINGDLSDDDTNNQYYGISETSPHVVLTVLRHLVNVVGVPQENISVGDPMKRIYKHAYDKWHAEFPDVIYLDNRTSRYGRTKVRATSQARIHYSDRGEVLQDTDYNPITSDNLYAVWINADYVINIPEMKGHKHGGVTMFAKNHFGSHARGGSSHLHPGLIDPTASHSKLPVRNQYGVYRVLVDMMGHELLSGKNLFYVMDALWGSDFEIDQPDKFRMAPFNDDWTSSLFFSQDPVAIESVGYDILRSEFNQERYPESGGRNNSGITFYPNMGAVDDYLHQAADKANWPEGIIYDPEDDGTPIAASLGVHEHWNNDIDKQYTRNLGAGDGIELVYLGQASGVEHESPALVSEYALHQNYPNPFNPSTTIRYNMADAGFVTLDIYNTRGQRVKTLVQESQSTGEHMAVWDGRMDSGVMAPTGVYIYQIRVENELDTFTQTRQMVLAK